VLHVEPRPNGKLILNMNARWKMNMKLRFTWRFLLWPLLALFLFSTLPASGQGLGVKKGRKRIDTWLGGYKKNEFQKIEQYADILNSLSVSGNPSEEFIKHCHRLHIEVYHLVSGHGPDINTPARRRAMVDKYVHECEVKNYDGIDLDYEHLDPSLKSDYSDFLRQMSSALHRIGKKLSICVDTFPTPEWKTPEGQFYDPKVVGETCDQVRVMCYDEYWAPGWTWAGRKSKNHPQPAGIGPTSGYHWAQAGMRFWLKYVPRQKLVMGLPAYSNDYALGPHGSGKQVYASKPQVQVPTHKFWLWHERLPMYLYMEDGTPHIFYASDAQSTKAQLETVDELGLSSIGFWTFNSVDKSTLAAVRAWLKNK